ncbi:sensor histidine kinase [Saccharothrix xinjiangensis]|uniref:histidine kinase n=1 Tax=Saccharothrix xinjiangensis TaxID=204798 RepID=A0ABV9YA89_9PSEU
MMVLALRSRWPGLRFLAVGTVVGVVSWAVLIGLVLSVALVVTLPLLPRVARLARDLAAFERRRVGRFLGAPVPAPPEPAAWDLATALTDPTSRRDVLWLLHQAPGGLVLGALAVGSPVGAVQNAVIAAVWPLAPGITTTLDVPVASWGDAVLALATALGYGGLGWFLVAPAAAWWARLEAARLAPPEQSLVERLAEVTATRADALEAHGNELRRIERSLHDGTQNRLVAVVMHLGMAERVLRRDPAAALPMLLTAQNAASDALAELRDVVRGIHPPVLVDRGLTGAVASLVAHCAIPCSYDESPVPRLPAAVEAAAYFVVAEALTNAVKHSGATRITVRLGLDAGVLRVEVADDGRGGADDALGTGLLGIRHRVAAFDGATEVNSPVGGPTTLRAAIPIGS